MRISWTNKRTNEVVLEKLRTERQLLSTIRRRQWRFIGHELRRGRIERNILEAEMVEKGQEEDKWIKIEIESYRWKTAKNGCKR